MVLGRSKDLFSNKVYVGQFHWIIDFSHKQEIRCKAKIRYRQIEQPATLHPKDDGTAIIIFDEPQRAITKGQAAVCYIEDTVIGGGVII